MARKRLCGWAWEREGAPVLTEEAADGSHSLEEGLRETGTKTQHTSVGQSQDNRSVLRPKEEAGVCQNPVLVQRPVCLQQPLSLLLPPNGMVRPVLLAICEDPRCPLAFKAPAKCSVLYLCPSTEATGGPGWVGSKVMMEWLFAS